LDLKREIDPSKIIWSMGSKQTEDAPYMKLKGEHYILLGIKMKLFNNSLGTKTYSAKKKQVMNLIIKVEEKWYNPSEGNRYDNIYFI